MTDSGVLEAALVALRAGLSVVPPLEDGSKRPLTTWKQYQGRAAQEKQVREWYAEGRSGLGLVCGQVSGNLEVLEFEGRAVVEGVLDRFREAAQTQGLDGLCRRISDGLQVRSPSGGLHLVYRCIEAVEGNQELARRPATPEELAEDQAREDVQAAQIGRKPRRLTAAGRPRVLIETRGEGGYVVTAPSNGRVHPSGLPYVGFGSLATITVVSGEERESLLELARTFDQMPSQAYQPPPERAATDGLPGDDFNVRGAWREILEPHGWVYLFTATDGNEHWMRPGKEPRGTSATINQSGQGVLYVFSSSTAFPEAQRSYSKFAAHAILNHGGDFQRAAEDLRRQGYGKPQRTVNVGGRPIRLEVVKHNRQRWYVVFPGAPEVVKVRLTWPEAKVWDKVEDLYVQQHFHRPSWIPESQQAWEVFLDRLLDEVVVIEAPDTELKAKVVHLLRDFTRNALSDPEGLEHGRHAWHDEDWGGYEGGRFVFNFADLVTFSHTTTIGRALGIQDEDLSDVIKDELGGQIGQPVWRPDLGKNWRMSWVEGSVLAGGEGESE